MKKLFMSTVCALCAALALAGDWFPVKITVAANATSGSEDIVLAQQFGAKCLPVDRFTATVTSGTGTGTVSLVSVDHDIETVIATSGPLNTTTLYDNAPKRVFTTSSVVGYAVVTGNVVVTGSSVNVTTNLENYILRSVRVKVAQNATNAVTVYNAAIITK